MFQFMVKIDCAFEKSLILSCNIFRFCLSYPCLRCYEAFTAHTGPILLTETKPTV